MANKTIYFKDDKLWERARKLAGKEGMSSVIQKALTDFVERKTLERDGFRRVRIESGAVDPDSLYGKIERAAFDGRKLATKELHFCIPSDVTPESSGLELNEIAGFQPGGDAEVTVYETKGHQLVLSIEPHYYAVYASLRELSQDPFLRFVELGGERAELLDLVATQLGKDWAVWID